MIYNNILLKKDMKEKRELINITLDRYLPRKDEYPREVHKAMRHTLFAGGKRIRPYLTIRTYSLFHDNIEPVRLVASAIEMLHTYTLIHDDLPAIDNDDYRRGKKTCHVVYGPGIALLAGDSLLTYTFEILSVLELDSELKMKMIRELTKEVGVDGLIAGQMSDIIHEGKEVSKSELKYIHDNKTGRLIDLSIRFACYMANTDAEHARRLDKYGKNIGLAFQITDDILDIEGDSGKLGKTTGKDEKVKKATYPAVYGIENSRKMAFDLIEEAKETLSVFGEKAEYLIMLADFIYSRSF
ncbi:MAG: polyprenyl synthetase family protein [Candidatus Cloacimonetes bacterium]|nr:polyprenyl synthetase family protein [Candidatus Cloacimonadota bacterium]